MPIDPTVGLITFSTDICQVVNSKKDSIESVFPNIAQQYKNHDWLSERVILAVKNKDVYELNWTIQNNIDSSIHS